MRRLRIAGEIATVWVPLAHHAVLTLAADSTSQLVNRVLPLTFTIQVLLQSLTRPRTFAWLNQFRRLHIRYKEGADIHGGRLVIEISGIL